MDLKAKIQGKTHDQIVDFVNANFISIYRVKEIIEQSTCHLSLAINLYKEVEKSNDIDIRALKNLDLAEFDIECKQCDNTCLIFPEDAE